MGAVTIYALLIAFLWGLSPVMHKVALTDISPQTTLVVSSAFYTVCTVAFAVYFKDKIAKDVYGGLSMRNILFLAFTSIVCGFFTNILYFSILKQNQSHIVSALIYSSPVFTLIMAYLLLRERITFAGFLGIILITFGVVLVAFNGHEFI